MNSGMNNGASRPLVPAELLRHLDEREHDARAEVERLRDRIAELSVRMQDAQQVVERLQLARATLAEIAGPDGPGQPGTAGAGEPLPPAYQEILAVFARADGGLRAKDLCRALAGRSAFIDKLKLPRWREHDEFPPLGAVLLATVIDVDREPIRMSALESDIAIAKTRAAGGCGGP